MWYRVRRLFSRRPPRWLLIAFGVIVIALFVWFVGPLVAIAGHVPLGGVVARLATIAGLAVTALGVWGFRRWRTSRRHKAMVDDLASVPVVAARDDADEDVAAMNDRAAQALALMKTTRVGKAKAFIYELPWYLIIGPPGAGKTTALQHAGLDFPVAQSLGEGPVRGIGGTRTIEWWFTDRAVLIDTAGRYTTQDSDQSVDAKAWTGLLDLLKRHRPRQPVTGILVAISTTELIGADEAAALAHGRAIRQRLNEVQSRFGLRTPVYVVLTKLDLLAGFTEFFDDLPQSEREQVWGGTLEFDVAAGRNKGPVDDATLGPLFDGLIQRLDERLLLRIQGEPDIARRALVFGFPQQVATLREPLLAMLRIIARETKFEPTPLVRGFYLTSATQFGRPIDRLLNALSARIGVALATTAGSEARGRSYFLHDLLARVVFPEAAIAGRDLKAERRRRAIRLAALVTAGTALLAMTALWTLAYLRNAALITRLEQRAEILHRDAAALGRGPIVDSDPQRALTVLNEARALPFATTAPAADRSPGFGWGIGREKALRSEVDGTYVNLLNRQYLPRLLLTLEGELTRLDALGDAPGGPGSHAADPRPAIYNLLRVYLMLGRSPGAPLERSAIVSYFADRWADAYPAEEQSDLRAALQAHLASLLGNPMTPPALNATLIADARNRIGTLGPGERVYVRMSADQRLRDLAPFALTDVPGVANSRLFARKSGAPLSTGVAGMFRHANFYKIVVPIIGAYAAQSADEGWVTGERATGRAGVGRLKDALLTAYLADFTNRWDNFIDDIAVSGERPIRDRIQLATRPPSPVRSLFNTLSSETNLTPPSFKQGSSTRGALNVAGLFSRSIYRGVQLGTSVQSQMGQAPAGPPGPLDEVIAHFAWLREMIPAGGSGPLDQALAALADVGGTAGAASSAAEMGSPALQQQSAAAAMAATAKLGTVSSTLPPQAGALFQGFVKASARQLNRDARDAVRGQYGAQLLPECQSIVKSGYPFAATPLRQVTLDDFSRLFRPSGLLDTFQKTSLAGQINTDAPRWKLTASGKALGLNPTAVSRFQDAAKISGAFFRPGDIRPNVRITATLAQLTGAQSVTLTIGGTPVIFAASGAQPADLHWPGTGLGAAIGFQRIPAPPTPAMPRTWPGEWGFAAMMHDLGGRSADARGVTLAVDDGTVHARIRLAIDNNPFVATDLDKFQCPTKL